MSPADLNDYNYDNRPDLRNPMKGLRREDGKRTVVYILGTTRSGTSALRGAVFMTRYKGYGEGHMAPLLTQIMEDVRGYRTGVSGELGDARSRLDPDDLLRHLMRGYEGYLAGQLGSDYILDKTPTLGMIEMVPDLNRLHEDARFIFCSRRHVDNIQSKLRKFPDQGFIKSCNSWASCHRTWLEVREELDGNYLEFDFHELATNPTRITNLIAAYLGLDIYRERVIMNAYLKARRPEGASDRDLTRFLKLSETGWSAQEMDDFRRICGDMGDRFGYGEEQYFKESGNVGNSGHARKGEPAGPGQRGQPGR